MKRAIVVLLCMLLGTSFAQSKSDLEAVKQRALATARDALGITPVPDAPLFQKDNCVPRVDQLYAGKPFLIPSLIQLTKKDLKRLRKRVRAAQSKDPNFVGSAQVSANEAIGDYKDVYKVPIL